MTAPGPAAGARLPRSLLWLLAGSGALGSLATHMFVPALPAATLALHAVPATMQLAIGVYMAGLAAGQLVAGPLVDRLGRRPVLIGGGLLFVAASIAAGLASGLWVLAVARFVQACGGAAGLVASRTLITDLSPRGEAAANMAAMTGVVLLSPTLAPTIGGIVTSLGGWRAVFALLAVSGVVMTALVAFLVPAAAHAPSGRSIVGGYATLARNRRFRGFAGVNAFASSALYMFLAGSSFLLIDRYRLTPAQAGLCYLAVAASGVAGTMAMRRLRRASDPLRIGLATILAGGTALLALSAAGYAGPLTLIVPMMLVSGGSGISSPTGIAGAMQAEEGLAGTGASLAGAIQMLASAIASAAVGLLDGGSQFGLACGVFGCAVGAFCLAPRPAPAG